jgi:LmbE family N-acetylglucosaminyl deacetylase
LDTQPSITSFDAEHVVFLLAHPDDELLMSGLIHFLVVSCIPVRLAWLTSGDLFGKGALREKELAVAADLLRIGSDRRYLFRLPDMGLTSRLRDAMDCVEMLIDRARPTHVFVPAYEGGHPDHDALNFVAYTVWRRRDRSFRLLEFPLYNGTGPFFFLWLRVNSFPPGTKNIEKHILNAKEIALKSQLIKIYSSQPRSMLPIKLTHELRRITRSCMEPYAQVPDNRNYQIRPHPGPLFYERSFNKHLNMTFEEFARTVAGFTSQ